MGVGLWALLVYLTVIVLWCAVLKRSVGESMLVGLVAICLFGGRDFPALLWAGVKSAALQPSFYAAMLFVFMGWLMNKTGIIHRLVGILNSLVGRLRGGSAIVSVLASALFGAFSGSPTANATTVGSITIPWMKEDGWPAEAAAVMNAGNAGLGISTPPCSSMFLLLGLPAVSGLVDMGGLYLAMWSGAAWMILHRLAVVFFYVRRYGVKRLPCTQIAPLRESLKKGWSSLFVFLGILLPVFLTTGKLSERLASVETIGAAGMKSLNLILLVPVFLCVIVLIEGRKSLSRSAKTWYKDVEKSLKGYAMVGGPFFFAYAASYELEALGLGADMQALLSSLSLSKAAMVAVIAVFVVLVAGPLNSTATIGAVGGLCFTALVGAGLEPTLACVTLLLLCSTEGATPPQSAADFISCGIADCQVARTFMPLLLHYCIPCAAIAVLAALRILPIWLP